MRLFHSSTRCKDVLFHSPHYFFGITTIVFVLSHVYVCYNVLNKKAATSKLLKDAAVVRPFNNVAPSYLQHVIM